MKSYVRHAMDVVGWMEKPDPVFGPDDPLFPPTKCIMRYPIISLI